MLDNAGITNTTIQLEIVSAFELSRTNFDGMTLEYNPERVVFGLLSVRNMAGRSHGPEVARNTEPKPPDCVPVSCRRPYERFAFYANA